jgi:RsmE family RNA methyltransferase
MYFHIPSFRSTVLNELESAHFFVMRVQEGKVYKASDLNGKVGEIRIIKVDKKIKTIHYEQETIPKSVAIVERVMFQSIPDKVYLDKLCEVLPLSGVTTLFLFYSDFSIQYPINQERITKILIRSCEQSEVAYLPKIILLNASDLEIELRRYLPVVLDCESTIGISNTKHITKPALIGPEGGWSTKEISNYKKIGLEFVYLGSIIYPAWVAGMVYENSLKV